MLILQHEIVSKKELEQYCIGHRDPSGINSTDPNARAGIFTKDDFYGAIRNG